MTRFLLHLLAVAAALPAASCQAVPPAPAGPPRDYHLSQHGNDQTGDGTAEKPFRSLARANKVDLNPGDRLLLHAGHTFPGALRLTAEDAGGPDRPVTIDTYNATAEHPRATIHAARDTAVLVENAGHVRVANLVVLGDGPALNRGSGVEFRNTLPRGQTLRTIRVENVDASGFGAEGVFVHGRPRDNSPSGYADVEIRDCVLRDNKHAGVYVTGFWAGYVGMTPHRYPHADVRVLNCLAADNPGDPYARDENRSGSGILLDGVSGALIDRCEATNNGGSNRARNGGPVGIWATISDRVVIQRCKSHRNRTGGTHDGGGFALDGGVTNSVLRHNVSEENDGSGYGLFEYPWAPPAHDNAVHDNVSTNDGRRNGYAGLHVWDDNRALRDVRLERNRVTLTAPADANAQPPRGLWLQSPIRNAVIANNTFELAAHARLIDVAPGQRNVRLADNAYRTATDRVAVEWQGRAFRSLKHWLAETGQSAVVDVAPAAAGD